MQNSPDPEEDSDIEPVSDEEELPPLTDEEYEALTAPLRKQFERESAELYGPPDVRQHKAEEYISDLIAKYSEPVIRGILIALSRLERPRCAHWLSEMDLLSTPLTEIIEPFEVGGLEFKVSSADASDYEVQISAGYGRAGDGGRFLIHRDGDTFTVAHTVFELRF
jgi:hypothetical protein